jgi:CHASE2 domain-containing sensor protein
MLKSIIRGIAVTMFVFLLGAGVDQLMDLKIMTAFDPIGQALGEFELTDIVFSQIRDDPKFDDRIVIVNIPPEGGRGAIAQQIQIISQYKPKVIGIDSFFNCEGGLYDADNCPQLLDTLGNLMLANAIQEAGNVVLVTRLLQSDHLIDSLSKLKQEDVPGDLYDSAEYSAPDFSNYAHNAYANLPTGDSEGNNAASYQEDVKICKSLYPQTVVNGKREIAFSVMMAMMYDSAKAERFLARQKQEEIIAFKGNIEISSSKLASHRDAMDATSQFRSLCFAVDWDQLFEGKFDSTLFEGKIVILGFLGKYFGDPAWEDKFFSPLNAKVAGRANPDMFGPVIHANSVAMILDEKYIEELPDWSQIAIAAFMCFVNVLLFYWIDNKYPLLYDGLSVVLQIIQILLISGLIVWAFSAFNLKLELSTTLGVIALVGPCFDICKSIENVATDALTKRRERVLTPENP